MSDEIFELINQERERQAETLMMIASENYASKAVRTAVGSVLMNKYAEGQVGARYYQGNGVIDKVEALAKARALEAFGLDKSEWGVNVQAHSGSPANLAVYRALLAPGETIMAMHLTEGGHLSHGWELPSKKISIVSLFWQSVFYRVDPETERFDYDELEKQAREVKPKILVAGGTAYPREIDHERMGAIAHSVGAFYMADMAHEAGLVAAGVNASPFPYADVVTMTTHKTLRGPRGAMIFSRRQPNFDLKKHDSSWAGDDLANEIDFSVFPGMQGGPHMHSIAGIAVALGEVLAPEFKDYAKQVVVNARRLAGELESRGYDLVTGGTDKHLLLIDLRNKGVSGWVAAWALEAAGIIVNRNTVPGETASPFYPSGVRIGTAAVTTRGMKEKEMEMIAEWIDKAVSQVVEVRLPQDKVERARFTRKFVEQVHELEELNQIKENVKALTDKYPLE